MQQWLTSDDLCRLTGIPMGTLKRLRAARSVRAAKPGAQGRGHTDRWSLEQALAIAVGRALRARGASVEEASPVLQYFWSISAGQVEAQFQNGETCLAVIGTKVVPKLVTQESILANEQIDYSTAATVGLLPAAIDVQRIWNKIKAEAGKPEVQKRTPSKTKRKAGR